MKVRHLTTRRTAASLALVAATLAAGGTVASVGTANAATSAPSATSTTKGVETALTGTTLDSVKTAVQAKYPGASFGKVTTEDTGGYEAHITTAAGQSLTALVSTAFAVTGTEARGAGHGHRGGGAAETSLTGTTAESVKAAVLARYPNATFTRVETDNGGVYEAHIVTAAGEKLTVALNKAFAITAAK